MHLKKTKKIFNNIGFKVGISMLVVAIVPLITYLILNNIVVSKYFSVIEEKSIISKTQKVNKVLQSEALYLEQLAKDNGIWDDFYQKIEEKDIKWFKGNYSGWVPDNFGIDLVIIANKNREIIDEYGLKDRDVSKLFDDNAISRVLSGGYDEKKDYPYGIKLYNGNLYIVGTSPILKSNFEGPSNGIIIFGKEITPEFLQELKGRFGYDIFLSYGNEFISNSEINRDIEEEFDIINKSKDQKTIELEKSKIIGNIPIKDISGEKLGHLHIFESRDIFISTLSLIYKNALWILLLSFSLSLIIGLKLKNIIINPIKDIENQITKMRQNESKIHVKSKGSNEIISLSTELSATLNKMNNNINQQRIENENLRIISNTDGLTSLYNHRFFYECFNNKIEEGFKPITVLFCDIDKFKSINDTYGHTIGDKILNEVGNIIKESVKTEGVVFRYGGEEFVVLMDNYNSEQSFSIAEKIRINIIKSEILKKYSCSSPITISIGLAYYPDDSLDAKGLIDKADKAMYFAKQNGRNQCCVYSEEIDKVLQQNSSEFVKQEIQIDSTFAIAAAIDAKDVYTGKHSELVTKYTLLLAEKLQLSAQDKYVLRIGALLHDCGKIGIPDDIIHKPSRLTDEEFNIIKNHTILGNNIAKHIVNSPSIIACIRNHHERWDGKGYPDGLSGKSINMHARIICIADAYHAMTSDRPYRKALSQEEAFNELRINKGTQFDPELVEIFIQAVKEDILDQNISVNTA